MEEYTRSSELASRLVTQTFSTSFSSAIKLFSKTIQQDIYNIYGLVRVADEIIDTYRGPQAARLLDELEQEVYRTLKLSFSANIIVHAFCGTAQKFSIGKELIKPFFQSMRMDLTKKSFTATEYQQYIYGSAEVVGLMCLKVFVAGDQARYKSLRSGAAALGSAFQKVNFLRDIRDDYNTRGRYYFPVGSFQTFDEAIKNTIVRDIEADFKAARAAISQLPATARFATALSYDYYAKLLAQLKKTPAQAILNSRVSVSPRTKLMLLLKMKLRAYVT